MELSNQRTKRWNKPKTSNPRERNNKEDNRQNQDKKINRKLQRRNASKGTVKSQEHKEIHKKKRCHYQFFSISLSYRFLQLLDLQRKEDRNGNKTNRENI